MSLLRCIFRDRLAGRTACTACTQEGNMTVTTTVTVPNAD
jgi:hypothetical protein